MLAGEPPLKILLVFAIDHGEYFTSTHEVVCFHIYYAAANCYIKNIDSFSVSLLI